ncbi:MAG: TSCPD domain-containing protein [Okeania sp. SIO3C4]|nr:TSCPD domain-containing protein [Okeania sp. SIO3C4]
MEIIQFDVSHEDTCMPNWTFEVEEIASDKIIRNVAIQQVRRGCPGHPKTISALVKDRPLSTISTEDLAQATCIRGKSCGMVLGECISQIAQN